MNPRICVLLSLYNGEDYLYEQIQSILCQKAVELILLVRDDGSTDNSINILYTFLEKNPKMVKFINPDSRCNLGVTRSFFELIRYSAKHFSNWDYFALADQDDIWAEDKLQTAAQSISSGEQAALYFGLKDIVNERLETIDSDFCNFHNDIFDILNRSNASGCTMVLNNAYLKWFENIEVPDNVKFLHDAVIYRLAICAGVRIYCDQRIPKIKYRQHGKNAEGYVRKTSMWNLAKKVNRLFKKREHIIQLQMKFILDNFRENVLPENIWIAESVANYNRFWKTKCNLFLSFIRNAKCSFSDKVIIGLRLLFSFI